MPCRKNAPRLSAKTYLHLAGAVLVFIALEAYMFMSGAATGIAQTLGGGGVSWLLVLAVFMGVSFLANWWANSQTSKALQYLGLATLVVAYSIIFVPLLYVAAYYSGGGDVILKAGVVAFGLFLGLTAVVFLTRKDFSFLGPDLMIGGFVALGFIASSILFGFSLGSIFAFVMVAFAGGAILYDTSRFCIATTRISTLLLHSRCLPASRFCSGISCKFLWAAATIKLTIFDLKRET